MAILTVHVVLMYGIRVALVASLTCCEYIYIWVFDLALDPAYIPVSLRDI